MQCSCAILSSLSSQTVQYFFFHIIILIWGGGKIWEGKISVNQSVMMLSLLCL